MASIPATQLGNTQVERDREPDWLKEYAEDAEAAEDAVDVDSSAPSWLSEYASEPEEKPVAAKEEAPVETFSRVSKSITESAPYALFSNWGRTALGNFADEIGAAGRSVYDIATSDEFEMDDYGALYNYNKKQIQDHYAETDAASPIASPVGAVAGTVAGLPGAAVGSYVAKGASTVPVIARSIVGGAGEGALLAAGEADENVGEAAFSGAKWGAAGGGAGAAAGVALGEIGKRIWRGLSKDQKVVAEKMIRDRAREYGVDADEVIKMYQSNPELTLADVDVAMRDLARGTGQRNPLAMNEARTTLTKRNAGAPERIGVALEEASGVSRGRADEIAAEAQAAREELGPQYNEINESPVPMGDRDTWRSDGVRIDGVDPELKPYLPIDSEASPAKRIIALMPEEYNAALANYRRAINDPTFDPETAGHIPGAMIQDMKAAADRTIGSGTASGAQVNAARSVKEALLETADEYIPGYGPLRAEYGARVLAPESGLEAAEGYMTGNWEKLAGITEEAAKMGDEAAEAFDAGVVRAADRAVRDAPGAKGTQFYGAPLLRNETAGARLDRVIPEGRRSQFDDVLEDERTMHTTMGKLTDVGSPTAQNQAADGRLGRDGVMGTVQDIASSFIDKLARSESQEEVMKILLDSDMDEQALRELLESPYIGKPVREAIDKILSTNAGNAGMGAAAGAGLLSSAMQ